MNKLPEFDPFISGQRLFIIEKPKFVKELEAKERGQNDSIRECCKEFGNRYGLSRH